MHGLQTFSPHGMVLNEQGKLIAATPFSSITVPKSKTDAKRVTFTNKAAQSSVIKTANGTNETPAVLPYRSAHSIPIYKTEVKIYLLSTGDDSQNIVKIRGYVGFPGQCIPLSRDLPVLSSFETENFGLGRLLLGHSHYSCGLPADFEVSMFEDSDLGEAYILTNAIDWAHSQNAIYADGGVWVWKSWNSADTRYVANLWVQVTCG